MRGILSFVAIGLACICVVRAESLFEKAAEQAVYSALDIGYFKDLLERVLNGDWDTTEGSSLMFESENILPSDALTKDEIVSLIRRLVAGNDTVRGDKGVADTDADPSNLTMPPYTCLCDVELNTISCKCCLDNVRAAIGEVCLDVKYKIKNAKLTVEAIVAGNTIFHKVLFLEKLPAVCLPLPFFGLPVRVCANIYRVDLTGLRVCMMVNLYVDNTDVFDSDVCYNLNIFNSATVTTPPTISKLQQLLGAKDIAWQP